MFIDALLLDKVAYGFVGGPEWLTTVVPLRSGQESRNAERSRAKHYYTAPFQNINEEHRHLVISAFNACQGRLHSFRFFDRMDYLLDDQIIGTGDGSSEQQIQLVKTYPFGASSVQRRITKPIDAATNYGRGERTLGAAPAWILTADNVEFSDWSINYSTGLVTLTAGDGEVIRATGWFDVPVRFDQDRLMFARGNVNAHSTDIELVEVWDDDE